MNEEEYREWLLSQLRGLAEANMGLAAERGALAAQNQALEAANRGLVRQVETLEDALLRLVMERYRSATVLVSPGESSSAADPQVVEEITQHLVATFEEAAARERAKRDG